MRNHAIVLLFLILFIPTAAIAGPVKIATTPVAYEAYTAFIEEKNASPYEITDFQSKHSNRHVVNP